MHKAIGNHLQAYIDGRLIEPQRKKIERHIEECASCRNELESLSKVIKLAEATPQIAPPEDFVQSVMARLPYIYGKANVPLLQRIPEVVLKPAVALASLLLLLGLTLISYLYVIGPLNVASEVVSALLDIRNTAEALSPYIRITAEISGLFSKELTIAMGISLLLFGGLLIRFINLVNGRVKIRSL